MAASVTSPIPMQILQSANASQTLNFNPTPTIGTAEPPYEYQNLQSTWSNQIQSLNVMDSQERIRHHTLLRGRDGVEAGVAPVNKVMYPTLSGDEAAPSMYETTSNTNTMHLELKEQHPNPLPPMQHLHLKSHQSTSQIDVSGAWAQMKIESLQQRLKEAEERIERECRRAEVVEIRGLNGGGANGDNEIDEGFVGDLNIASEVDNVQDQVGNNSNVHSKLSTKQTLHKVDQIGKSFETAALLTQGDSTVPLPIQRHNVYRQNDNLLIGSNTDSENEELIQWKQRALKAEERLSQQQQDYSSLISPHTSTQSFTVSPPHTTKSNSTVESTLIQLKNHEIQVLRHQISRLEQRIHEECSRNTTTSLHSHEPPIAIAECPLENTNDELFRMLRDEIRHLQYQLMVKNQHRSPMQSTTGSTLSSLENEREEEEEEDGELCQEEDVRRGTSWGLLCCVRRGQRGYGRVSR
jgi:hypothetical protein